MFASLLSDRARMEERREAASAVAAREVVSGLAGWAPSHSDAEVEDELCRRIGARLREWEDAAHEEEYVTPYRFGVDLVPAAADAVRTELGDGGDGWREPWQVLTAVSRVVPESADACAELVRELRHAPGGKALPPAIEQPAVRGEVKWTRDAYGSRFGVTAAFDTPNGPDRWYLWDVDACGFKPFTVHSGYYPGQAEALAAWRAGVGEVAAGGSAFTSVDDVWLLRELLPAEEGFFRIGGETTEQLMEYHRSRRLAEAVAAAHATTTAAAEPPAREQLVTTAAAGFVALVRDRRGDLPDLPELAEQLADSWSFETPPALYHTCSPHRVALNVAHLRDYYTDDFAAQLVDLMPDWVACWRPGTERRRSWSSGATRTPSERPTLR